ncbi:hypothetical protein TBCH5v1_0414 [Thermococcus barophilus]|uniref:MIP18 family-like domain-containing protein n=2 Tax=Thermococcus barophilus TaxID=55802 RepID=A0A0S1X9H0_THEBA|nr:iron-sulfur cluster assembly protein [Thermococcus barophilus]ADT83334.1 hypothetical protein TERMP_00357 [Thermococcus barophilus MP]ALM74384.1 hypothetical protein TBCH5v1_0414 [Thermococcus barophilus]
MRLFGFLKRKDTRDVKRKELPEDVKRVVEILKRVRDPETDLNIVDEGLVYGVTIEGKKAQIFLFMARSTPECHFCQMMAINVQRRILRDIINVLKQEGFNKVEVYNEIGLLLEEG